MLFLIGTFGLNYTIFIPAMAVTVFHAGAGQYGLLSAMMAVGTVGGALLAAGRRRPPGVGLLAASAALFGCGSALAALMPTPWLFGLALVVVGLAALTFTTGSNSFMQLASEPALRGRVLAIRLAIALGGTPIGAPVVGSIANGYGPRWALGVAAAAGFGSAAIGLRHILKHRAGNAPLPAGAGALYRGE